MTGMTRTERVSAVLAGNQPDRPPVSFWHHFPSDCRYGQSAVDAHLQHLRRYDLDFLKVMNDNPYPARCEVRTAADLRRLPVHRGDEAGYGRQLDLIRALKSELSGKVLLVTTLFHAWSTLRRIVTPEIAEKHGPPNLTGKPSQADRRLSELLAEDRAAVGAALDVVAASQANFARKCVEAGADGIYLSVREDWVNSEAHGRHTYDELVRPGDGRILAAVRDAGFNMLHVCGRPPAGDGFAAFAAYPVQVVHWADRAAGPAIREVISRINPVVAGGVDNLNTLPHGAPAEVEREVRDALQQAGERPMIVAPGCTYDPDVVPEANLEAIVRSVRDVRRTA